MKVFDPANRIKDETDLLDDVRSHLPFDANAMLNGTDVATLAGFLSQLCRSLAPAGRQFSGHQI